MLQLLTSFVLCLLILFALIPTLIFFLVTQLLQSLWFSLLSTLYPELEFIKTVTVRSLLDTHRNQGIGAVLLCIKGRPRCEFVKQHLNEIVNRKLKNGKYSLPRLRQTLVTRFGTYAWEKAEFELDKNVTMVPSTFKNRAVNECNIQEYVSDLVSKYLPQNSSPWHVIIIPTSENQHYILVKLHHILLNEHLNIGDLLPLVPPTRNLHLSSYNVAKSPLINVCKKPEAIVTLHEKLSEELSNYWNEFLSNYDPLERVELLKTSPNLFEFIAIAAITLATIFKETRRGFAVVKSDFNSRFQYFSLVAKKEMKKRSVNLETLGNSILVTFNPVNFIGYLLKLSYFVTFKSAFKLPEVFVAEIVAFYNCITKGHGGFRKTFIGTIYTYVPLIYRAFFELIEISSVIFHTPKDILQNILFQKEYLQSVSLCGRKCVAWSDPIKTERLKSVSSQLCVREFEILLAGLSKNLSKYLSKTVDQSPDEIAVTLRNINSNYIFATGTNVRPENSCSGIVCMGLPILNEKHGGSLRNLMKICDNFEGSLKTQQVSYLLTILQTQFGVLTKILPSTLLAVYLRYLSRKFAVSITEITCNKQPIIQKTLWGADVTSVIYFRPPQANTCISLCLSEYADHFRLGVMCDSRLVPNHILLAKDFPNHINELGINSG